MKNITELLTKYNIKSKDLSICGSDVSKVKPETNYKGIKDSKSNLILVPAINPTPKGEGKTTCAITITDALNSIKEKTILCLRQPSIGPTLGMKGGAAGNGWSEVVPADLINYGLTGDFFYIETINNLIASIIDNTIYYGNIHNIDPNKIVFKRCIDVSDRSLRDINISLIPKEGLRYTTGFNMTSASEVMAVLCLSKSANDFVERINNIIVAYTKDNKPVHVKSLHIDNAIKKLAEKMLWPNAVTTKRGSLCFIHGGPFANIAHGCNSIIALNTARKYAKYIVTEAGFGADLGAEKFINILSRQYMNPKCIVIVTTIKSLKYHGMNTNDLKTGILNLEQHVNAVKSYGITPYIVINIFNDETEKEINFVKNWCKEHDVLCGMFSPIKQKDAGAIKVARDLVRMCKKPSKVKYTYKLDDKLEDKITKLAKNVYGIKKDNIVYSDNAKELLAKYSKLPYYVCMAKTPYSLSSDAKELMYQPNAKLTINDFVIANGAQFIIPICESIFRMPGLPKVPNAQK